MRAVLRRPCLGLALAMALAAPPLNAARSQQAELPPAVWEAHYKETLRCFNAAHDFHTNLYKQLRIDAEELEKAGIARGAASVKMRAEGLRDTSGLGQIWQYNNLAKEFRSEDVLRRNLYRCTFILRYLVEEPLEASFDDGQEIGFWAIVMEFETSFLAGFLSEGMPYIETVSVRPNRYRLSHSERTAPRLGGAALLAHMLNLPYAEEFMRADIRELEATDPYIDFGSTEARKEALELARSEWCRDSKRILDTWVGLVKEFHQKWAERFDYVGSHLVKLTGLLLSRYRAYAVQALDYLNTELAGSPRSPLVEQLTKQANEDYHRLIDELLSRDSRLGWSVAAFLDNQAKWYRKQRERQEARLADKARQITEDCGGKDVTRVKRLAKLQTEDIDAALKGLREEYDRDLWPPSDGKRCWVRWDPKHYLFVQVVKLPATITECLLDVGTGAINVAKDALGPHQGVVSDDGAGAAAGRTAVPDGRDAAAGEPDDGAGSDADFPDLRDEIEPATESPGLHETGADDPGARTFGEGSAGPQEEGVRAEVTTHGGAGPKTSRGGTAPPRDGPQIKNIVVRRTPSTPGEDAATQPTQGADGPRISDITVHRAPSGPVEGAAVQTPSPETETLAARAAPAVGAGSPRIKGITVKRDNAPPRGAEAVFEAGRAAYLEKDYPNALVKWRTLAEEGHAGALNGMGVLYANGFGVAKDEARAVQLFRRSAEQGFARGQLNLGISLETGGGAAADPAAAVRWYQLSAEQGNAEAQFRLGVLYVTGEGVPADSSKAAEWFGKAAEQGNVPAQVNLGMLYEADDGPLYDPSEAARWYRRAAQAGDPEGQYRLGSLYRSGKGVTADRAAAARWFRAAAEQGHGVAQFALGTAYQNGEGVPQNNAMAYAWLSLASTHGYELAEIWRDGMVAPDMSPEEIIEAERWVQGWSAR